MMIMAGFIVSVIVMLMGRNHPEKRLLSGIRGFFHGCAEVSGGFARTAVAKRVQKADNRQVHLLVRMIPERLRVLAQSPDYRLFPDNPPDKVNHLLDTLQSLASRLRIVAGLLDRVVGDAATSNHPPPLGAKLPQQLHRLFQRWAHLPQTAAPSDQERAALRQLYDDLEQRLKAYETDTGDHQPDERMLTDLTALLGGVRGLLDAMAEVDRAITEINWEQWAVARF